MFVVNKCKNLTSLQSIDIRDEMEGWICKCKVSEGMMLERGANETSWKAVSDRWSTRKCDPLSKQVWKGLGLTKLIDITMDLSRVIGKPKNY